MSYSFKVESGKTIKFPVSGKYCDRDIVVTAIADNTFKYSNSYATAIGAQAFRGMSPLEVDAPAVTSIGNRAFSQSGIKRVVFPNLTSVGGDAFTYCYSLTYADMGNVASLPSWCFAHCKMLTTLILRKTSVVTLTVINALAGTPIENGTGYVYVHDDLVENYKVATNWSTYASQIRPISELELAGERLPAEYQEVAYLEGTGTQWIDTGVTINTSTDEVEFVFQNTESVVYKWFFGEHDNNARFGLGSGDGVDKRNVAYGSNTYKVTDAQLYNSQHSFSANANGVYLDDSKVAGFVSFASSSTVYLFNLNLSSGNYVAAAKVWSYRHTRNGVSIRDLVPCYRKSDNKPGMFDLVTNEFFTNNGTGEFLYGIEGES